MAYEHRSLERKVDELVTRIVAETSSGMENQFATVDAWLDFLDSIRVTVRESIYRGMMLFGGLKIEDVPGAYDEIADWKDHVGFDPMEG